ncbi:hypothetical protein [Natronococcus wangiae]|uniref:hypothetical protein n=1 Tax=Natronococcus wangiae TaxID=3068275 RepID=UPI00273ED15D|nr:hypothetical protein [Natronococcus sp. AD5]
MVSESPLPTNEGSRDRRRAALYVAPFLAVGLFNLAILLGWGLDPLWAFAIVPPILFITAIAWVAFRHGFDRQPHEPGSRP